MSCSAGLGGVVGECAWRTAEVVVERDGGCEGEEACGDACFEPVETAGAVAFEGEDVFAGLEDRLDALADRGGGSTAGSAARGICVTLSGLDRTLVGHARCRTGRRRPGVAHEQSVAVSSH